MAKGYASKNKNSGDCLETENEAEGEDEELNVTGAEEP